MLTAVNIDRDFTLMLVLIDLMKAARTSLLNISFLIRLVCLFKLRQYICKVT